MKHILTLALILTTLTAAAQFEPIPYDKKWHIAAGAFAGTWGTFAGNSINLSAEGSALFGVAAAVTAGVGKELMDVTPRIFGHDEARFDVMDVAATTMGGIIGAGLSYAALKIFKKPPVIYSQVGKGFEIGVKIRL